MGWDGIGWWEDGNGGKYLQEVSEYDFFCIVMTSYGVIGKIDSKQAI